MRSVVIFGDFLSCSVMSRPNQAKVCVELRSFASTVASDRHLHSRLDPVLRSRQPVKRMKHRSDEGRSSCSENRFCSIIIVLYLLEFRKERLRTARQKRVEQ